MHAERQVATLRLLARLKAIDSTLDVQTARAYASRYIREQEPLILRLLDAGVGVEEVLADLAISFPSISKSDLRYAIAQLLPLRHAHPPRRDRKSRGPCMKSQNPHAFGRSSRQ